MNQAKAFALCIVLSFFVVAGGFTYIFNEYYAEQAQKNKEYLENSVWVVDEQGTITRYAKDNLTELEIAAHNLSGDQVIEWKK